MKPTPLQLEVGKVYVFESQVLIYQLVIVKMLRGIINDKEPVRNALALCMSTLDVM